MFVKIEYEIESPRGTTTFITTLNVEQIARIAPSGVQIIFYLVDGKSYHKSFKTSEDMESYYNYVMEQLRVIDLIKKSL